ncbi:MAG: hypothetical protein IKT00_04975 [Prevotella sp.]|nr:hypothetical protein [Prevotella sp.]
MLTLIRIFLSALLTLTVVHTATAQQDSLQTIRPTMVLATDTVVVVDLETGLPIRDVHFFTNTGEMRKSDYRGRFVLPDSTFKSATLTHGKYLNRVLERYEITDTLEMLPSASSLGDVVVWGKDRRTILTMVASVTEGLGAYAPPAALASFDFFKLFEKKPLNRKARRGNKELLEHWDELYDAPTQAHPKGESGKGESTKEPHIDEK